MTFRNSILAGELLIRSGIKSPDYVPGVSGWRIAKDGTAEFNNVTVRGQLVTGPDGTRHLEIGTSADKSEIRFFTGDPSEFTPAAISAAGDALSVEAPNLSGLSIARITLDGSGAGIITLDTADHVRLLGGPLLLPATGGIDLTFAADTDTGIGRSAANQVGFWTGGTLRGRMTNAGLRMDVDGTTTAPALSWQADPNTGIYRQTADAMSFTAGGTTRLVIAGNAVSLNVPSNAGAGTPVHAYGFGELRYFTSSRKAKTRIRPLRSALDTLRRLRPRTFHARKGHGDPKPQHVGFIVEEVAEVDPRLVVEGDYPNVDQNALLAVLVGAVAELADRLDKLDR